MTTKLSPPNSVGPTFTTEYSCWNSRLTSLYGFMIGTTLSTPFRASKGIRDILSLSPIAPIIVLNSPRERCASAPTSCSLSMTACTCSSLDPSRITIIIACHPVPFRSKKMWRASFRQVHPQLARVLQIDVPETLARFVRVDEHHHPHRARQGALDLELARADHRDVRESDLARRGSGELRCEVPGGGEDNEHHVLGADVVAVEHLLQEFGRRRDYLIFGIFIRGNRTAQRPDPHRTSFIGSFSKSCLFVELPHLCRLELAVGSGPQRAEPQVAYPHAVQGNNPEPQVLERPPYLPLPARMDHHVHQSPASGAPRLGDTCRPGVAVLEDHALSQPRQILPARRGFDLHDVLPRHAEARVHEPVGEKAVIG